MEQYKEKLAAEEPVQKKDTSIFSRALKTVAYIALGITLVLAGNVLFGSSDEVEYVANHDTFYLYGFICTVIYFVSAYWAVRRGKRV